MDPHLISPHGGKLVDLLADDERAAELKGTSRVWLSWDLSPRQLCDLELLLNGGFSPLRGFLTRADYEGVCASMRLADGTVWPVPVTLDVPNNLARRLRPKVTLALRDPEGVRALRLTPRQLRAEFKRLDWRRVVAFQTRNPLHRAHQELTLKAAREVETLLSFHWPCASQVREKPSGTPSFGKTMAVLTSLSAATMLGLVSIRCPERGREEGPGATRLAPLRDVPSGGGTLESVEGSPAAPAARSAARGVSRRGVPRPTGWRLCERQAVRLPRARTSRVCRGNGEQRAAGEAGGPPHGANAADPKCWKGVRQKRGFMGSSDSEPCSSEARGNVDLRGLSTRVDLDVYL